MIKKSIRKLEKYINEKTSFSMSSKFENGEYKIRLDGMEKYTVKDLMRYTPKFPSCLYWPDIDLNKETDSLFVLILKLFSIKEEFQMARGHLYEATTDLALYPTGTFSESDFYSYAGHQFDYISELGYDESLELGNELANRMAAYGAKTGTEKVEEGCMDGDIPYFILTDEVVHNYFDGRLKSLKEMVNGMTVDRFVKKSWELKNLVEDVYSDAVSFNGSFQTLDRFIKDSPKDVKIYIGKVFYMK